MKTQNVKKIYHFIDTYKKQTLLMSIFKCSF